MTENTIREDDDVYALDSGLVDAVLAAVDEGSQSSLLLLFENLHEADIADILEQIGKEDRRRLIHLWGDHMDGEVLSELEEGVRDEVMAEEFYSMGDNPGDHFLVFGISDALKLSKKIGVQRRKAQRRWRGSFGRLTALFWAIVSVNELGTTRGTCT